MRSACEQSAHAYALTSIAYPNPTEDIFHNPLDHKPVSLLQLPCGGDINALHIRSLLQPPQIGLRQLHALVLQACQTLVVSLQQEAEDDTADSSNRSQANDDTHCRVEVRRGPGEIGEGSPDGSGVAKAVDECEGGGALGWRTGDGVCDPGVGLEGGSQC